ncbi:MAG: hypothetical protein NTV32_00495 [Gammaproteobacteria bacterium]|nr:hypothetical protein [Gammaproteobacteria bacterium]
MPFSRCFRRPTSPTPVMNNQPFPTVQPGRLSCLYRSIQSILYPAYPIIAGIASALGSKLSFQKEVLGALATLDLILTINTHDQMNAKDWGHLCLKGAGGALSSLLISALSDRLILPESILLGLCMGMSWQLSRQFNRRRQLQDAQGNTLYLNNTTLYFSAITMTLSVASSGWGSFMYLNPSSVGAPTLPEDAQTFWGLTYGLQAIALSIGLIQIVLMHKRIKHPQLEEKSDILLSMFKKSASIQNIFYFLVQAGSYCAGQHTIISKEASYAIQSISFISGCIASYFLPIESLQLAKQYKKIADDPTTPPPQLIIIQTDTRWKKAKKHLTTGIKVALDTGSFLSALTQARQLLGIILPAIQDPKATLPIAAVASFLGILANLRHHQGKSNHLPRVFNTLFIRIRQIENATESFSNAAYTFSFAYGGLTFGNNIPIHERLKSGGFPFFKVLNGGILIGAMATGIVEANQKRIVEKGGRSTPSALSISTSNPLNHSGAHP